MGGCFCLKKRKGRSSAGENWMEMDIRPQKTAVPAASQLMTSMLLYVYLYSTSIVYFWTEPSDCKPFWWVCVCFVSVLFDTFLWMAVHHWCCSILWSQKHVCSLRPLLVRKPSVLCAFFLSVNSFKDIQKKELWRLPSRATGRIHALAEVKGCFVWNSAAA